MDRNAIYGAVVGFMVGVIGVNLCKTNNSPVPPKGSFTTPELACQAGDVKIYRYYDPVAQEIVLFTVGRIEHGAIHTIIKRIPDDRTKPVGER